VTPLPSGFSIALDRSVSRYDGGHVLIGGSPTRGIRLTATGRVALERLREGKDGSEAVRRLARRLIDAGMAHPRPPQASSAPEATVIVPVRDRPAALERCLAALGDEAPVIVVDDGSRDAASVADICKRHGAMRLRLDPARGPGAARNAALARVETELVAFLDSDCLPQDRWLSRLADHLADPLVGAVAPRIRPTQPAGRASVLARFTSVRSPLDMGPEESPVVPGGRVAYVPTAALLVRRRAVERGLFDPSLRYGEDVDLVWRLHDAGWRIRYVPTVTVEHAEPCSWRTLLRRHLCYGTSAAPLSRRHPGRLAPAVVRPAPGAAAALALAHRPVPAIAATVVQAALLARRTRRLGVPPARALLWSTTAAAHTMLRVGRAATVLAAPVLLAALGPRVSRPAALTLLFAPPLEEWVRRRPRLDPLRWTVACIADDLAYGMGVWIGCVDHRTTAPLRPTLSATSGRPSSDSLENP
jgi:mycofactocin glycosyltransferase